MDKPKQQAMFEQGEDLPLFSGTPMAAHVSPFCPQEEGRQETLPGMPKVDWMELGERIAREKKSARSSLPASPGA